MNLYPSGAAGHHSHFSFSLTVRAMPVCARSLADALTLRRHSAAPLSFSRTADPRASLVPPFVLPPSLPPRHPAPEKHPAAARGTQPSSKNTSRSADPKSESTPRISRAILSDQRAIGLTIFLFVALAAQVIFKATFGNGDSNMPELFSRVTYLLMRAYRWPQACLDHQTINGRR